MSVTVMGLVWEADLPPNHKLVLLAYADHANDDGTSVFPGEDYVAAKTGYTAGNIRRVTKELVDAGFLHRIKPGYRGQRAEWMVDVHQLKGAHSARLSELKAARQANQRRAASQPKARAQATPNVIEPSEEPSSLSPRRRDLLWEAFVAVHGEPATKTERGKFNKAVAILKEAAVPADEYPLLVLAYAHKNPGASQPAPMTIATRVGELRHYLERGPIRKPSKVDDAVLIARRALEGM